LLEKNSGVHVFSSFLETAGQKANDLKEGIHLAQNGKFVSFTKGRTITLGWITYKPPLIQ